MIRSRSSTGGRVALVLAAILATTANTSAFASAAPASARSTVGVYLVAQQVGATRTICPGDQVQIRLTVFKRVGEEGNYALGRLVGVPVNAAIVGSGGVGTISPPSSVTSLSNRPVGVTYFAFKAEKAGTVIINFQAVVSERVFLGAPFLGDTLTTQVVMQVEDCKYRVSVTSRWTVPGEARITVVARIDIAGLVEDGGGHYSGTARVQWIVYTGQVGDCSGTLPPDSNASVTGQIFGPDEFILDVDYETAVVPLVVDCRGAGGTRDVPITPAPLTFIVSAVGGRETLPQLLRGPGNDPGTAIAIVRRASGQ